MQPFRIQPCNHVVSPALLCLERQSESPTHIQEKIKEVIASVKIATFLQSSKILEEHVRPEILL